MSSIFFMASSPSPRTSRGEHRGEGPRQTPAQEQVAAPHPNPLPILKKNGERGQARRSLLTCRFMAARILTIAQPHAAAEAGDAVGGNDDGGGEDQHGETEDGDGG